MTQEVEEALGGLIDALLESPEYENYHNAQKEISRDRELQEKVDEYRRRNFELQQSTQDPDQLVAETEKLDKEFEELRSNSTVHRFLASELGFIRMMQAVYGQIMDELDFDF